MTDEGILYKLMILYMLNRVNFPLTGSQISQFILNKKYTDYFNFQITINELIETDFIKPTVERNHSLYEITEQGKEAIELFEFQISDAIKMDIEDYLQEQKIELRNESAISSDYYPSNNEYIAQCSIKERNKTLLEIKLSVPTQEQAIHICDSWRNKSEDIYQYLVQEIWMDM